MTKQKTKKTQTSLELEASDAPCRSPSVLESSRLSIIYVAGKGG